MTYNMAFTCLFACFAFFSYFLKVSFVFPESPRTVTATAAGWEFCPSRLRSLAPSGTSSDNEIKGQKRERTCFYHILELWSVPELRPGILPVPERRREKQPKVPECQPAERAPSGFGRTRSAPLLLGGVSPLPL